MWGKHAVSSENKEAAVQQHCPHLRHRCFTLKNANNEWLTQEYSLVKVANTQNVLFVQLVDGFEVQLKIAYVQQTVVSVFGAPKYLKFSGLIGFTSKVHKESQIYIV